MEDNFSRGGGERGMAQAVIGAMGSSRGSFACQPTTHLPLCGPVLECEDHEDFRGPHILSV